MAEHVFMGVDVGTTFIKAVVYGDDFSSRAEAQARTPWSAVSPGIEADPEALADTTLACIERALLDAGDVRVRALGVTGMGETGVLADAHDRPVAPAIAWHDERGAAEAAALAREVPGFARRTGRAADDRPSLIKWRWLAGAGYDLERVRRWYAVPEWIARRLGGAPASEMSLASRTGTLDIAQAQPSAEALEWSGADANWFDELVPAGVSVERVTAGPTPLRGCVISVAGLDCYASAHALGADHPRTTFLSCGTSGAAVRVLDHVPDLDLATTAGVTVDRYIDGRRLVALGARPCGLTLQPLRDRLGEPEASSTREWSAAYAAVAASEWELISQMQALFGGFDRLVAAGGWIAHPGLQQALRRHTGPLLEPRVDPTSAARGAALLAREAVETR